jgi:hypothetical protein
MRPAGKSCARAVTGFCWQAGDNSSRCGLLTRSGGRRCRTAGADSFTACGNDEMTEQPSVHNGRLPLDNPPCQC